MGKGTKEVSLIHKLDTIVIRPKDGYIKNLPGKC